MSAWTVVQSTACQAWIVIEKLCYQRNARNALHLHSHTRPSHTHISTEYIYKYIYIYIYICTIVYAVYALYIYTLCGKWLEIFLWISTEPWLHEVHLNMRIKARRLYCWGRYTRLPSFVMATVKKGGDAQKNKDTDNNPAKRAEEDMRALIKKTLPWEEKKNCAYGRDKFYSVLSSNSFPLLIFARQIFVS